MAKEMTDDETVQQIVDRLQARFPEMSREDIEAAAWSEYRELSGRPVRDYLAILVERSTKKRLKKTADG